MTPKSDPRRSNRGLLILGLVLAAIAPTPAAWAVDVPGPEANPYRPVRAVIELFTSQGCSSCPPADEVLKSYAEQENVIALSLPVDYWDYIGWKDTLASPKNTERQRSYAKSLGSGSVYTPQAVINGVVHVVGSNRSEIEKGLEKTETAFARRRIPLRLIRDGRERVGQVAKGAGGERLPSLRLPGDHRR